MEGVAFSLRRDGVGDLSVSGFCCCEITYLLAYKTATKMGHPDLDVGHPSPPEVMNSSDVGHCMGEEMKKLATCLASLAIILAIMTAKVFAQAPVRKIPIFFQCTCDDPVGSRLATAVRDLIAVSPRYFKSGSEFNRQDATYFQFGQYAW